jgi:hypothetical protein
MVPTNSSTPSMTPTFTLTRTPTPSLTPTPTEITGLIPGLTFPIARVRLLGKGLQCSDLVQAGNLGFFMSCEELSGYNLNRVIFFGSNTGGIDYIKAYVSNFVNPSNAYPQYFLSYIASISFSLSTSDEVTTWTKNAINTLDPSGYPAQVTLFNNMRFSVYGGGRCTKLEIGENPPAGWNDSLKLYSDWEYMDCWLR